MLCRDIYDSALRLLGESVNDGENDDYEERAPYLIASFCNEAANTDRAWRISREFDVQGEWNSICIPLTNDFPLSERFVSAAAFYVAAMLVIDYNESLSDKLYERFCDAMSTISEEIPAIIEAIANRYFD